MDSSFTKTAAFALAITLLLNLLPIETEATWDAKYGALGQGFYLPKEDLLSDELTARGTSIFDHIGDNCVVETGIAVDRKDETFYHSTKDLYSSISTDSEIDLSLKGEFTMGASVRTVTNNLASHNVDVSGSSLELLTATKDYSLSQNCINQARLDRYFLKAFMKLKPKIKAPWLKNSWIDYSVFYKTFGSHVVSTVLSGSSIYQYAFAEKDKDYSQRNFTVKACASLAGPTEVGELGLSACSGVTKDEINSVANLKMVQKLVIRGGTASTRAKLANDRAKHTIETFLQEGDSNPSPVQYKFIPIWDILQARFIGTPYMAQARNLEEYYKGLLDYGCKYQKTANGKVLQKFVLTPHSTPEFPSYQCMLGPEGCHDDDDCHYKDAFWCSCGGQSCIRYDDLKLNSGDIKTIAKPYNPVPSWWGWHGCRLSGLTCWCSAENDKWEIVWQDDREHVLREVHSSVSARMRKARAKINELEQECARK